MQAVWWLLVAMLLWSATVIFFGLFILMPWLDAMRKRAELEREHLD